MRSLLSLALCLGVLTAMAPAADDDHECALNFKAKTIDGKTVDLEDYEGNVVLVVNTASRMESGGVAGRIQITESTHELIKDDYICEPRGAVAVKGKGDMSTYFLSHRADAAPAGG